MDTQRLRQKILDLAIRGKLVEQNPNDEPASALLERIHGEKLAMVERGELKPKDIKNDSVIYVGDDNLHYEKVGDAEAVCIESEIPFGLPAGWAWARVGSLCPEPKYGTTQKSEQSGVMPVLRMGNITRKGAIDYSDLVFTSDESDIEKYLLEPGDVIFNRTNSKEWVGKTAYYSGDVPAIYAGYLVRIHPIGVLGSYINRAMCSQYERDWCMSVKTDGVNQSNINVQKLKRFLLPIPPLAEQRRIVSALDGLLGLVERIEREEAELAELVSKANAKVLDLAIRGKLAEQDPADEPASKLLKRIHAEKLAMVERGELPAGAVKADTIVYRGDDNSYYEKDVDGKSAPVPIEVPFEIPSTWRWARLLDLYKLNPKNNLADDTEVSFLPMALIEEGLTGAIHPEVRKWEDVKKGYTQFADGDIVFAKISPCFENGKYFIARNLQSGAGAGTTELYVLRPYSSGMTPEYSFLFLASGHFVGGATKKFKGTVGQQRVKKEYVEEALIPIPPLNEQQRIVEAAELINNALNQL